MHPRIGIVQDAALTAVPEYHAGDVAAFLARRQAEAGARSAPAEPACLRLGQDELTPALRERCDLLIVPYLRGEFTEAALAGLVAFHAAGGALLFLGDLPHVGASYPPRHSQAHRFHLTTCGCGMEVFGATEFGRGVIGELQAPEFFRGRRFGGLRVTAYPPDTTHPLVATNSGWECLPVVAVERYGERFLGARLAVLGFNGGEPRENAAGAYQMPWTYDPGLLDRRWAGLEPLLDRLLDWLQPPPVAGALDAAPLAPEGESLAARVLLANPRREALRLDGLRLLDGEGRELWRHEALVLAPGERRAWPLTLPPAAFGSHRTRLLATRGGSETLLHEGRHYRLPADAAAHRGFGASTFWAFRNGLVVEDFHTFCRELRRCGCQYLRVNIPWEDVEPEPGRYDWRIPDQMLALAQAENLALQFWVFPTTRGSGLGDAGVPWWSLREPAIDHLGRPGYFPTLWSSFYREHYFAMVAALAKRYAQAAALTRLIVDFGNSDFPYGYHYYVNPPDWFDYSPQERAAWAAYLEREQGLDLEGVARLYGRRFASFAELPVPRASQDPEAWRLYLAFREWSVQGGIRQVHELIRTHAPAKLPPDLPGHGLGSIADFTAFHLEAKARHWDEEQRVEARHVHLHCAGREWGGEPWQVGSRFAEFDVHLFQSLRLNATYFTVPGPDLAIFPDDLARTGFIRRSLMGAVRPAPELAVIDRIEWNQPQSLAHVAARLDQGTDILGAKHRYDFTCYRLLVLPPDDLVGGTATGGGGGMLLPPDEDWYRRLRDCVERGLQLLVFPNTCALGRTRHTTTFLRQALGLTDVNYGTRQVRRLVYPAAFGGGAATGQAATVLGEGEALWRDRGGAPLLLRRPLGRGAVWLAGFDNAPDSLDGAVSYRETPSLAKHTLARLAAYLGVLPRTVRSAQANVAKELVTRGQRQFLLLYSELAQVLPLRLELRLERPCRSAWDLASGERFALTTGQDGWARLELPCHPAQGRYLCLE